MQTDCHHIAYSLSQFAPVSTTISTIGSMTHLVASCLYSDNIPILKERLPNVILQPQQLFCKSVKKFLIFCFKSMSFAELSQLIVALHCNCQFVPTKQLTTSGHRPVSGLRSNHFSENTSSLHMVKIMLTVQPLFFLTVGDFSHSLFMV